jgi:hypothetical protein
VRRADNLTTFNLLEPSGPVHACNGVVLLLITDTVYLFLDFVLAFMPEDESRAGFRNVVFKKHLDDRQNPNKEIVSLNHTLSLVLHSVEYLRLYSGTIFFHVITLMFNALIPPGHKFLCSQ